MATNEELEVDLVMKNLAKSNHRLKAKCEQDKKLLIECRRFIKSLHKDHDGVPYSKRSESLLKKLSTTLYNKPMTDVKAIYRNMTLTDKWVVVNHKFNDRQKETVGTIRVKEWEHNTMMGDYQGCIICDFENAHGRRDHAFEEAEANAQAICTAINNTFGKGFDPNRVEEMYEMLVDLSNQANMNEHERYAISEFLKSCKL